MIKQLGIIGFYIKFNESASAALKFLEVFSSSAMSTSLFSASTNSSQTLSLSPTTASFYLNGSYSSSVCSNEWVHATFKFDPKLETDSDNNFVIRFGDLDKSNFNIQNLYILDNNLSDTEIRYIHNEFIGTGSAISGSASLVSFYDRNESNHSSSTTVYQPYPDQLNFKYDVTAVASATLNISTALTQDEKFIDGVQVDSGNYIINLNDNKVYQLNSSSILQEITTINTGDYFNVLDGQEYKGRAFVKSTSSFTPSYLLEKIVYGITDSD